MKNFFSSFKTHLIQIIKDDWKAVLVIIIASTIQGFAVNYFTLHYRFPDLGVSGIAVLTNYVFGISPSWVILIGNILLVIWAHKDLNVRFLALTLIAVTTLSFTLCRFLMINSWLQLL